MSEGIEIPVAPETNAPASQGRRIAIAGAVILVASVFWTFIAAAISGGDATPVAGMLLGASTALGAARVLSLRWPPLVPAAVVATAVGIAWAGRADLFSASPLSGSFGYANAKGAFFMLAAFAGVMLAIATPSRPLRVASLAGAAGFMAVPVASRTAAATALGIGLPLAAVGLALVSRRLAVVVLGATVAATIVATAGFGMTYEPPARGCGPLGEHCRAQTRGVHRAAVEVLGESRLRLWREALQLASDNPATGVGPGRFALESPTALVDPDLTRAHSGFLQQAAEGGVPAGALLAALFAWGFLVLHRCASGRLAVPAAAVLAGAGTLGAIDYVFHFPAVVLTAAALVGAGMVPARTIEGER